MDYLFAFLIISFSILLHEVGHLIAGKCANVPMKQFSIGFGPALLTKQWKGTIYKISSIPVGGYVMPDIENETDFFTIPIKKRLIFTLGGPFMNLVLAYLFLAFINWSTLGLTTTNIFILPLNQIVSSSLSIIVAFSQIFQSPDQLSGVVGVISSGGQFIQANWVQAMTFATLLNINLAIFNLLPIPPLDGGKIVTYLLESIDKRLTKIQMPLSIAGWALLLLLMLYATFNDVQHLFNASV